MAAGNPEEKGLQEQLDSMVEGYIHDGLVNPGQMGFSRHIVICNICGIVVDISNIGDCQQI